MPPSPIGSTSSYGPRRCPAAKGMTVHAIVHVAGVIRNPMRIFAILVGAGWLMAQAPEPLSPEAAGVFAIWPATPPGSENWTWHEQTDQRSGNRMVRNVVTPTLTMYRPVAGKANGASVIIA